MIGYISLEKGGVRPIIKCFTIVGTIKRLPTDPLYGNDLQQAALDALLDDLADKTTRVIVESEREGAISHETAQTIQPVVFGDTCFLLGTVGIGYYIEEAYLPEVDRERRESIRRMRYGPPPFQSHGSSGDPLGDDPVVTALFGGNPTEEEEDEVSYEEEGD